MIINDFKTQKQRSKPLLFANIYPTYWPSLTAITPKTTNAKTARLSTITSTFIVGLCLEKDRFIKLILIN